jgi:hypothetical protein
MNTKALVILTIVWGVICVGLVVAAVYVAAHFIEKVW